MNQEKFGKLIKILRKKHNLTQKQLADKYNVTYQAVSKWENGLNMPDMALIKQISKDFNISIDELLDGKYNKINVSKKYFIIIGFLIFILVLVIILIIIFEPFKDNDFHFKTLTTECEIFKISGNISYNEKKSAIYINNIEYCGGEDTYEYKMIECILYETHNNIEKKISTSKSNEGSIKLEDFLKDLTLTVDNYEKTCEYYENDSLYLEINATDYDDKVTSYRIPLTLNTCSK